MRLGSWVIRVLTQSFLSGGARCFERLRNAMSNASGLSATVTCSALLVAQLGSSSYASTSDPRAPEAIEWLRVWVPELDRVCPTALLVGDSIAEAYYPHVQSELRDKVRVSYMATSLAIPDARFIRQLETILGAYNFDIIHFNNGLHGPNFDEATYERAIPLALDTIRRLQPKAKLIVATSTPSRVKDRLGEFAPFDARVRQRNAAVRTFAARHAIPVVDLYEQMKNKKNLYVADGVHFTDEGAALQGRLVGSAVSKALRAENEMCAVASHTPELGADPERNWPSAARA